METFTLTDDYIELTSLLKLCGPKVSGGEAKHLVSEGLVTVDNQIELRKKCKIRDGSTVKVKGFSIKVEK